MANKHKLVKNFNKDIGKQTLRLNKMIKIDTNIGAEYERIVFMNLFKMKPQIDVQ